MILFAVDDVYVLYYYLFLLLIIVIGFFNQILYGWLLLSTVDHPTMMVTDMVTDGQEWLAKKGR